VVRKCVTEPVSAWQDQTRRPLGDGARRAAGPQTHSADHATTPSHAASEIQVPTSNSTLCYNIISLLTHHDFSSREW